MTVEEIKALQAELGVTVDGVIGPETKAAAEEKINQSLSISEAELLSDKYAGILNFVIPTANTNNNVNGNENEIVTAEDFFATNVQADKFGSSLGTTLYVKLSDGSIATAGSLDEFESRFFNTETGTLNEGVQLASSSDIIKFKSDTAAQITLDIDTSKFQIDTSAMEETLGTYAEDAQVAELAQTGPSTFEQAKGLYPFLDDRLIRKFMDKYAESGNERLALAEMRADPIMNDVYPGIKRTDGTLRMTEKEYVAAVDNMKATVRTYNLNANEFQDDIVAAISGDVSPLEFRQRMDAGYEGVVNNIPQIKEAYLNNFGIDLPDESIFAMFVSPNVSTKILEGQIRASQVLGEAEAAGFGGISAQVGQSLVQQGLSQEGARKGFGQAALTLTGLQTAAQTQGREGPTATEYVQATQLGQAEQLDQLQKLSQQIQSESSLITGAAKSQTGAVTGLEEA